MKPVSLEQLVPQSAEFYLKKSGRAYKLRPISLADEAWMQQTFGGSEKISEIFKELRMQEICKIVYRLLSAEDKQDFKSRDIVEIDDQGNEKVYTIGGVELLASMIVGIPEKIVIIRALLETLGFSQPVLSDLERDQKKSDQAGASAGPPSSTSSPMNTDGAGIISGHSPDGRSTTLLEPLSAETVGS